MPASIFLGNPKKTAQHQLLVEFLSQKLGKQYVRFRLKKGWDNGVTFFTSGTCLRKKKRNNESTDI